MIEDEELPEPDWQDLIELDKSPEIHEIEEVDKTPGFYAFDDPITYRPPYEIDITYGPENNYCLSKLEHINVEQMAVIIQRDNYFATDSASKDLYVYISQGPNAGIYIEARDSVNWAIKQVALRYDKGEYWASKNKMSEVYNWINQGLKLIENPEIRHINLANGLIYLTPKGELIDFSEEWTPEYLTTTKLPIYYDPNAKCPAWEKFVKEVFPEDSQHLAWEIAALLMVPLKNKAASAIILKGQKNTGKTTFQNGILAFIGEKNYCSLSPHEFGERFMNSKLKGVLVNVVGDLTNSKLSPKAVGTIKQLIGNDLISGENKYGATYSFKPYARNLFSCNEMPTCDSDDAFFDRFLIIPFNHQFSKNPFKEKELNESLGSYEELSGLFNKALEVLPKVIAEGIKATDSMKEEHLKVIAENDPLIGLNNHCEFGLGYATPTVELHEFYKKLEANDWMRKSNVRFGRDFKRLFPNITRKQLMIGQDRVWCYVGIKIVGKRDEEQLFDSSTLELEFEGEGQSLVAPEEGEEEKI